MYCWTPPVLWNGVFWQRHWELSQVTAKHGMSHHVRVVFCDAAAYDQGIMAPEEIAGAVKVRGRGGTKLQPGIDLLEKDKRLPKEAPLLIITDGACDRLNLRGRKHAYLMPWGSRLPFVPKAPVFRLK